MNTCYTAPVIYWLKHCGCDIQTFWLQMVPSFCLCFCSSLQFVCTAVGLDHRKCTAGTTEKTPLMVPHTPEPQIKLILNTLLPSPSLPPSLPLLPSLLSLPSQIFFWGEAMEFVISVAGAIIFCGFIIFDTHLIMHKLSPEEYILASVNLYLDFINLFLYILRILQAMRRE